MDLFFVQNQLDVAFAGGDWMNDFESAVLLAHTPSGLIIDAVGYGSTIPNPEIEVEYTLPEEMANHVLIGIDILFPHLHREALPLMMIPLRVFSLCLVFLMGTTLTTMPMTSNWFAEVPV